MTEPKKRYTRAEKKVVKLVRDDYDAAKLSKESTCYHDIGEDVESGDWNKLADRNEKMFLNWAQKPSQDEFQSNVKSPMTSGRIDSTMQKLRRIELQFVCRPENSDAATDKAKAQVIQELLNQVFKKGFYKYRLLTGWKDCLIHPVSFMQVYYLKKHRTCKFAKVSTKNMTPKEKRQLKKGEKIYESKEIVEYDDIALEPIKFQEAFPDPSARTLHGQSYEAQYFIRRMLPSVAQFRAMFDGDPDAKNLDKVVSASVYGDEVSEFFKPPRDVEDDDYVELLHYYNKPKDRYIVLANDVVVKDMPLPYNHKQIPIVTFSATENPHQFYHLSIPDRLAQIQAEEEIVKNMIYDKLHTSINPDRKIKKSIYGELTKAWQQSQGQGAFLPVNNMDDEAPVEYPTTSFDTFRALDQLSRDASLATQIDPIQMGVMQKYVAATTSMMTKEQMDSFINGLIDGFTESLSIIAYQVVALMKQYYTVPQVKGQLGKDSKNRKVRLEGIEINPDTMEVLKKGERDYSFLEVKPEYFEISGDWDITLSPESVEVLSKAIEMQKSQANAAQLAPFMVDPTNSQATMQHPCPWIDGPKYMAYYLRTNNLPAELLTTVSEDEDIAIQRAEKQGKLMLKGSEVAGVPGESEAHKKVHLKQLSVINQKVDELEQEILNMGELAPIYVQFLPQGTEMEKQKELARKIALHLQEDDAPKPMAEEIAVEKTMPTPIQGPQVPMPPGLTQAGGQTPPIPSSGNQHGGMMGGEAGHTGRIPMFEGGM